MPFLSFIFEKLRMKTFLSFTLLISFATLFSCVQANKRNNTVMNNSNSEPQAPNSKTSSFDTATFGAGCFWCVEAQFQMLDGVIKVESGFSGGHVKNPSY